MKPKKLAIYALLVLLLTLSSCSLLCPRDERKETFVDCAEREVADLVEKSPGRETFDVSGTCKKPVTISQSGITIRGGIIDAQGSGKPAIDVVGAQDIIVEGTELINGEYGFRMNDKHDKKYKKHIKSTAVLKDVKLTNNKIAGILVGKEVLKPRQGEKKQGSSPAQRLLSGEEATSVAEGRGNDTEAAGSFLSVDFALLRSASAQATNCVYRNPTTGKVTAIGNGNLLLCGTVTELGSLNGIAVDGNLTLTMDASTVTVSGPGNGVGLDIAGGATVAVNSSTLTVKGFTFDNLYIDSGALQCTGSTIDIPPPRTPSSVSGCF